MTTESGFGGGWWKADNNFQNLRLPNSAIPYNNNRLNDMNFFKEKGQYCKKPTLFFSGIKLLFIKR